MADKNFIMKQKTSDGYDVLFPKTTDNQVELSDGNKLLFKNNATVDQALTLLGYYNQYFWKRRLIASGYKEVRTITSNGVSLAGGRRIFQLWNDGSPTITIQYADTISFDSTGNILLNNPQTLTLGVGYSNLNANLILLQNLKGKYFNGNVVSGQSLATIYFLENFSTIQRWNLAYGQSSLSTISILTMEDYSYLSPPVLYDITSEYSTDTGVWELVYSTNRNAYPDTGTSGGYDYIFLGTPYDNAIEKLKIKVGSYIGTGTYGTSNKNTIACDFVPKIIIVGKSPDGLRPKDYYWVDSFVWIANQNTGYVHSYTIGLGGTISFVLPNSYSLSWSSNYSPELQLNQLNTTYQYIAIG